MRNNSVDIIVQALTSKDQFPLDAFPKEIERIISHFVEVKQFPLDFFSTAVFTAFSTAIGKTCTLNIGPYTATANVFAMIVGAPGINKSGAITSAYAPLNKYQQQRYEEYLNELASWKSIPKDERESIPEPVFQMIILSSTTMEALIKAQSGNLKGCTILVDELAGWVKSLNQYRSGGDTEDYLSAWLGVPITKNRVSGIVHTESTLLSILGGIQPSVLDKVSTGQQDNGFLDRFLFAYPDGIVKPYPSNSFLNPAIEGQYSAYLNRLLELSDPAELTYTAASQRIITAWVHTNIDLQNLSDNDTERSIRAKYDIYIHRFALILQLMQYAVSNDPKDLRHISEEAATGAAQIADYFYNMADKVRLRPKHELFSEQWRDVFSMLPTDEREFTTANFKDLTERMGISESSSARWLKEQSEPGGVLTKIRYGVYSAKK